MKLGQTQGYHDFADHLDGKVQRISQQAARRTGNDLATINPDWSLTVDSLRNATFAWGAWTWQTHLAPQYPSPPVLVPWVTSQAVQDESSPPDVAHQHLIYAEPLTVGDRVVIAWTMDGTYPIVQGRLP